ncbi:helix-turn-helix domain-containing protein [Candidatus Marinimicrobia bacterium]|nr:helix-turn-helix domain-containing protein [Candidatus Neomarinimicrobiota bacterium]
MSQKNENFYEILKETRKTKQITLKEISDYTKINISYLESLENGDFDILPTVYTRLFLRSYCDYIDLDSKSILDELEIFVFGHKGKKDNLLVSNEELDQNNSETSLPQSLANSDIFRNNREFIITSFVIFIIISLFLIISSAS